MSARRLFNHVEEHARENHAEQHQNRDDDSRRSDDGGAFADELRTDLVASLDVNVRQRGVVLAGLALDAVDLLATCAGNFSVPVAESFDAAASQARLGDVPGGGHLTAGSVELDRRVHLLLHGELDLLSEDIAENSADQHRHEDQKQQDEVLQMNDTVKEKRLMDFYRM